MNKIITAILLLVMFSCNPEDPGKSNTYTYVDFGQASDIPQRFGDEIFTTTMDIEFGINYNYNYHELYFTRLTPSTGEMSIFVMYQTNDNKWEPPKIAPFSGTYRDACPSIVKNGNRIYFTSYRNSNYSKIWYTDRNSTNTWNTPITLIMPDTITKDIRNICFVNDSVFYFDMEYGNNDNDIFRGIIRNEECVSVQHTGQQINSAGPDVEAVVDPDEKYMIFYSIKRNGHIGTSTTGDLYISYNVNGEWSIPVNMGTPINSTAEESWPSIDFNNNVLYFNSNRSNSNGFPNIYWVKLDKYIDLKK